MSTVSDESMVNFFHELRKLYCSLTEDCRDEAEKLILAKYLEIIHKDFLDKNGISDISVFLEDSSNLDITFDTFFMGKPRPQYLPLTTGIFCCDGETYYNNITEVKNQIDKLVKDLDFPLATATDES